MDIVFFLVAFVSGVVATVFIEIAGLGALLEPLRTPIELLLGLRG